MKIELKVCPICEKPCRWYQLPEFEHLSTTVENFTYPARVTIERYQLLHRGCIKKKFA